MSFYSLETQQRSVSGRSRPLSYTPTLDRARGRSSQEGFSITGANDANTG